MSTTKLLELHAVSVPLRENPKVVETFLKLVSD
jgi:hypothetical protein